MSEQATIRPEILATKMAAVSNFKAPKVREQLNAHPRLFELLWFIQAMSMQPGGLDKFCEDFVMEFAADIGTPSMFPVPKGKAPYPRKQRDAITREIAISDWALFLGEQKWPGENYWDNEFFSLDDKQVCSESESARLQFLASLSFNCFNKICRDEASLDLARFLARVCNEPGRSIVAPWYFHRLLDALFQKLDSHARQAAASLATTTVSLKIFDAMEYAWQERALVSVTGEPRMGKTQGVKTWCAMWPGKSRLVSVPCSNSDSDLYKAFADAIGIEYSFTTSARKIKATVEYVICHSGLMFAADEAHWLFPARFSANTPPMRLNWLRSQLVDKHCPVVMVSTPQEFERCKSKYVKATSHRIEQFMGRKMLEVVLPTELDQDDLFAVARLHFPDMDDDFLQVIVGTAMRSESYLMAVEAIAKRVRFIARRDNHPSVTLADLKLAISEIIPGQAATPPVRRSLGEGGSAAPVRSAPPQRANPVAVKRSRATKPAVASFEMPPGRSVTAPVRRSLGEGGAALEAPARSMTPATLQPA